MTTYTPQQLQEIVEANRKYWRGEEGGEGANLRGANLRGANLEGANLRGAYLENVTMNWNSHGLIAERLRRAAGDDAEKRLVAGYILISRDWCWKELLENAPSSLRHLIPWTFQTMRTWRKDGDGAHDLLSDDNLLGEVQP